nr:GntR family transcriptional regulator [Hamadaea tsunoensis]
MDPEIRINPHSHVPPFEQVRQQIADLIALGTLRPDQRLPPVRQLAADLGLANGTVARAYQELEAAGLVTTGRAAGTRIAAALPPGSRGDILAAKAVEYVAAARRLGAGDEEIARALTTALNKPVE